MHDTPEQHAPLRAQKFDRESLSSYLYAQLDQFCGIQDVRPFSGGASNPTFLLVEREPEARLFVLRKKPPGKLLASAHQVEREYRVMAALQETGVPVPKMRLLCTDETVIGTNFYLMDYLEGRIFRDARLPGQSPGERATIYDALNETLAKLHKVDCAGVGLTDFGKSGDYFERQIGRWTKQYRGAETEHIPAMEKLIEYLPKNIPRDDTVSIAHGDYRLENVIFHPTEPKIIAVLDWELSTIGSPLADISYNCLLWHSTSERWGTLQGIDLAASGIPSEADYRKAYCLRTGRADIPHWPFYLAFSLFRLAAIAQGVYKRILDGNASSAMPSRNETPVRAGQAWDFIKD